MAVNATEMRRDANRTADITAQFQRGETRGQRCGRTAGRTTRRVRHIPRIVSRTIHLVVALQIRGKQRHVGFADHDGTGILHLLHRNCRLLRHMIAKYRRTGSTGHARHFIGILDGHGQAVQWSPAFTLGCRGVGFVRPPARRIEIHRHHGIERGIFFLNPGDIGFQQCTAADVAFLQTLGQLLGILVQPFVIHALPLVITGNSLDVAQVTDSGTGIK